MVIWESVSFSISFLIWSQIIPFSSWKHLMITTGQPEWSLSHQHSHQEEGRTKGRASQLSAPFKEVFSGKLLTAFSWPAEADFKLERTDRWIQEGRGQGGMKWEFALESALPPQIPGRFFPPWFCVRLGLSQLLPFHTRADQHHTHTGPCCCHQKGIRCWAPLWIQPFGPLSPSQVLLLGTGATEVQKQVGYRCWGAQQNRTTTVYLEFHVNSMQIWMDKKATRFDKM